MDYLKQFVILFGGLKPGTHHFSFDVDDLFFAEFEYSEIKKGKVAVHIDLEREEKILILHFILAGKVEVNCDRCNEPFLMEINGREQLIIKFGKDFHEENEEVQIIPEGETQIDLSTFIYEYVHLLLPIRRVHPEDENGNSICDPEVIGKLEADTSTHRIDPRWEVLNKLRDSLI